MDQLEHIKCKLPKGIPNCNKFFNSPIADNKDMLFGGTYCIRIILEMVFSGGECLCGIDFYQLNESFSEKSRNYISKNDDVKLYKSFKCINSNHYLLNFISNELK